MLLLWSVCFAGEAPDLKRLEQRLRSRDKWIRKSAVVALAKEGSREAWELIVPRLGDNAGEVADTAEYVLGRIDDPKTFKLLAGRAGVAAKDEWTRRRAWGVAGRVAFDLLEEGFRANVWKRGLHDSDVEVRVIALRAAERWGTEPSTRTSKSWGAIERGIHSAHGARDERVAAAALYAGAAVSPEDTRAWCEEAVTDRRAGVRAAAAGVAPGLLTDGVLDLLQRLAHDPTPSVRAAVLEAADDLSLEDAAPLLVAALDPAEPLGLRHRAWGKLRARSGFKHGLNSRAWQAWVRNPRVAEQTPTPAAEASVSLAQYRPPSDRVVFLLDLSGSVWRKREDGSCPRDDLVRATCGIVQRFDESVHFDVGVFTGKIELQEGRLRAAKRGRVRAATRFLEDAKMQGPGDAWSAIEAALLDGDVDTIVLLTDGAPTGGQRHRLELLPDTWAIATRPRPVALEVLLIDAPPRIHRAWQAIVAKAGGQVRAVDLEGL